MKPIIHTHLRRLNLGPSFSSNFHLPFQTLNLILSSLFFLHQSFHLFFSFWISLNSLILSLLLTSPSTFPFPFIFLFIYFFFSFLFPFFFISSHFQPISLIISTIHFLLSHSQPHFFIFFLFFLFFYLLISFSTTFIIDSIATKPPLIVSSFTPPLAITPSIRRPRPFLFLSIVFIYLFITFFIFYF